MATVGEVVAAITSIERMDDQPDSLTAGVLTKYTEPEHRLLKTRAAEAGVSLQDYVRGLVVKFSAL